MVKEEKKKKSQYTIHIFLFYIFLYIIAEICED